ncbi:HAD family hydrolase [Flaviflexus huanghaiensis]|uniref:HAD family hydrolase n=1 Tax=Flaviflexus huanghaiensis TaxID=1111473 RepID=UPI0015FDE214|nr:HAD family hydrolase [Flaviflexus huanghaiensis]
MAERLNGSLPDNIDDINVAVFDIDGTLAAENSHVSDRTIEALRQLSDAGVHVVLASGRIAPAMRKLFARMERDGFIIGCNGAITVHTDHDHVIGSHPLEDDMYGTVIDFGRAENLETVVFGVEDLFTEDDGSARQLLQGPNEGLVPVLTDLDSLDPENRLKVMYYVDPEREPGIVDRLRERFPSTVKTLPEFYELTHEDVDKWTGLQPILDELGASPDTTLGVGDSENDLSWLPNVGISIAMGNAYSSVKDACDYEIGTNDDDAVADLALRWATHRN